MFGISFHKHGRLFFAFLFLWRFDILNKKSCFVKAVVSSCILVSTPCSYTFWNDCRLKWNACMYIYRLFGNLFDIFFNTKTISD